MNPDGCNLIAWYNKENGNGGIVFDVGMQGSSDFYNSVKNHPDFKVSCTTMLEMVLALFDGEKKVRLETDAEKEIIVTRAIYDNPDMKQRDVAALLGVTPKKLVDLCHKFNVWNSNWRRGKGKTRILKLKKAG